jgi:NAD dependent epimerase/dehydratase family enzyme
VAFGRGLAEMLLTGQRALPRQLALAGFSFDFPTIDAACADLFHSGV